MAETAFDWAVPTDGSFLTLPTTAIKAIANYRTEINQADLEELAESIRTHGIMQPIIVRPLAEPDTFGIVAGERRWRAAQLLGPDGKPAAAEIPVLVRHLSDAQVLEIQLTENIQRANTTPLEDAKALQAAINDLGWDRATLKAKLGKSDGWLSERLGLLELARLPDVLQAVEQGRLSLRTALTLRPFLPAKPRVEPGSSVKRVAEMMVEEAWPAARAAAQTSEAIRHHSRPLWIDERPWGNYWDPKFDLSHCQKCQYRKEITFGELQRPRCLNSTCWEKKQRNAHETATQREKELEAAQAALEEQQRVERMQRAITKAMQSAEEPALLPSETELVQQITDLALARRELTHTYLDDKRKRLQEKIDRTIKTLGFDNQEEVELWLGNGIGRQPIETMAPDRLAGRIAEALVRKQRGETPKDLATEKRQQQAQGPSKMITDPTQIQAAKALANIGEPAWNTRRAYRQTIMYTGTYYLDLNELINYWQEAGKVATSGMPVQMGYVKVEIPEQSVSFQGSEEAAVVRQHGDQLTIYCSYGQVTDTTPDTPVLYRVNVIGNGSPYQVQQQLVIPFAGRHVVITGDGSAGVRKDRLGAWWALLDQLPACAL